MPLVAGDLRTVAIADVALFGTLAIFFFCWKTFSKQHYLRNMLTSYSDALLARGLLSVGLLIGLGILTRTDGVDVFWLRPAFYMGIYYWAFTYGLADYFGFYQDRYATRRTVVCMLLTMGSALAMVLAPSEDHRTLLSVVGGVLMLYGLLCMLIYGRHKKHIDPNHLSMPWHQAVTLVLLALSFAAGALMFLLGHAFLQRLNFVQENWGFWAVDLCIFVLVPIWTCLMQCDCPSCPLPLNEMAHKEHDRLL
jgi:hypothetical protein